MVYSIALEKYKVPSIISINVTILRGARRLRFSSKLRAAYQDFSPILWQILSKLGYKRYLQRIYVSTNYTKSISGRYLELPILIKVIQALKIAYIKNDVFLTGFVNNESQISSTNLEISKLISEKQLPVNIQEIAADNIRLLLQKLVSKDRVHTNNERYERDWNYIFKHIFPGVITNKEGELDLFNTQLSILKRIENNEYEHIPIVLNITNNAISHSKAEFIKSLPLNQVKVVGKKCYCIKNKCHCTTNTKKNRKILKSLLELNAWRIEEPFLLS